MKDHIINDYLAACIDQIISDILASIPIAFEAATRRAIVLAAAITNANKWVSKMEDQEFILKWESRSDSKQSWMFCKHGGRFFAAAPNLRLGGTVDIFEISYEPDIGRPPLPRALIGRAVPFPEAGKVVLDFVSKLIPGIDPPEAHFLSKENPHIKFIETQDGGAVIVADKQYLQETNARILASAASVLGAKTADKGGFLVVRLPADHINSNLRPLKELGDSLERQTGKLVVIIPNQMQIDELSDEQLESVGLVRKAKYEH